MFVRWLSHSASPNHGWPDADREGAQEDVHQIQGAGVAAVMAATRARIAASVA
jgi:hypothetical protein